MRRYVFHPSITAQEKEHYLSSKENYHKKMHKAIYDKMYDKMEQREYRKRKAEEFLHLYEDFELNLIARNIKTRKEKEIDEKDQKEEAEYADKDIEYYKIPRVLTRQTQEGIDYNAHWVYMKELYWKNQEQHKHSIIFFSKEFFQSKTLPETLTEENKIEINLVRANLGWTFLGLFDN